jgi:ABC-2 type transport system ATP-binding protein
MCDTLLFVDGGQLVFHGDADDLKKGGIPGQAEPTPASVIDIRVLGEPEFLLQWASMNPGWNVIDQRRDGARLKLDSDDPILIAAGLRKMIHDGVQVLDFHQEERRLEDAFIEIIRAKRTA